MERKKNAHFQKLKSIIFFTKYRRFSMLMQSTRSQLLPFNCIKNGYVFIWRWKKKLTFFGWILLLTNMESHSCLLKISISHFKPKWVLNLGCNLNWTVQTMCSCWSGEKKKKFNFPIKWINFKSQRKFIDLEIWSHLSVNRSLWIVFFEHCLSETVV